MDRLRAGPSEEESFVEFYNTTNRHVNLHWTNYNGDEHLYLVLKPGDGCKVNTYRTHPWTFSDERNGEKMHVLQKEIFWPQAYKMRNPRKPDEWVCARRRINIHFPLRTLRESCLWAVAEVLRPKIDQQYMALAHIETLPLPRTVMVDLHRVLWRYMEQI